MQKEFDKFGHPSPEVKALAVNQQERKVNWNVIEEKKVLQAGGRQGSGVIRGTLWREEVHQFSTELGEWSRDRRIAVEHK
ncbi:MAG: hypothetical protein IPL73_25240 [Candidatus Obscuribacter sp.]|nr:hypothetical protein [Candidatus Obscuribacter sp.]